MTGFHLITILAVLGLSGPAISGPGDQKLVVDGVQVEAMFIVIKGSGEFAVFVEPNNIDRELAIKVANQKAGPYCRDAFSSNKIRYTKIKRRSWSTPDAWQINGRCE